METTDRAQLRDHSERDCTGEASQILAAGIVAHVGITESTGPVVIPMNYHYDPAVPRTIYLHGSQRSRLLQAAASGADVCVTVTLTGELVYSKIALNHSINFRSVVCFCRAAEPVSPAEERRLLDGMIARYFPGRTVGRDYEAMPEAHVTMTKFVPLTIVDWSAKKRTGGPSGPGDDDPKVPGTAGVVAVHALG